MPSQHNSNNSTRNLRGAQVRGKTNLCKTTIRKLIIEDGFPPPRRIVGVRKNFWLEAEVDAWLANNFIQPSESMEVPRAKGGEFVPKNCITKDRV